MAANPEPSNPESPNPPAEQRSSMMRDEISAARGEPYPIVGIGASAGGLEAISGLFHELPPDSGMAFVIVQHLDPKHQSQLTELLARTTEMPVTTIEDGVKIEPNRVYIIPPNTDVTLQEGRLRLSPRKPGLHMPVDSFFASLARAQGSRAIGIVLSGNASDGSQGVRMIKGECGLTFAQDEESARHGGMPRNAVATGAVDFVMSPAEIAGELFRLSKHPYIVPPEPRDPDQEVLPDGDGELRKIFAILRSATKVDFTLYKRNTIRRRIGRRMIVQRTPTLSDYAGYLDLHPAEARELYRDLLINVTNFFRDPDAFVCLGKLIADVLSSRKSEEPFRVWVPGCATGEEVYSLAICLAELSQQLPHSIPLQLFGTDINEAALERGRSAIYPGDIAEEVSAERLRRFFTKIDSGYQISRAIRDCCVFARQDLTRDAPFAHTDLIACRNVLIYMDAALQRRILPIFHYSLNPSGLLLLGSAETVGAAPELFDTVDKQHRIFGRKAVAVRLTLDLSLGRSGVEPRPAAPPAPSLTGAELVKKIDRVIQSKYSPAAVVVDGDLQILHFRGHTSFYFDPAPGDASLNLLRMLREGMVVALRRSIEAAANQGISIRETGIQVEHRGEQRRISLEVTPISGASPGERYFLVVFDETVEQPKPESSALPAEIPTDSTEYLSELENDRKQLQHQLAETREYLRNLNEDHEAGMEELRAANEEVRSSNEELQSTNEELSTTKEELQSANEELTTVNEELQNRNHELDAVNNDLNNLLTAVSIPIVMVDGGLRVRRFNTSAEKLLELGALDIGRPVAHLRSGVEIPQLEHTVRTVLETLATQQEEVRDKNGRWYSLIVRPYRTADNRIDGAVIVFVDIDPLKRSLTLAEEARDYAEGMIETVREPLVVLDGDLRVQRATSAFFSMFHVSREETVGRLLYDLGNGQWNRPRLRELLGNALFRHQPFQDFEVEHDFPHIGRKTVRLNAQRIPREDGDRNRAVLLSMEDISVRRAEAEIRYQRLFEGAKDGMLVLDAETRLVTDVNPAFLQMTGFSREDFAGKQLIETPPFRNAPVSVLTAQTSGGQAVRLDVTFVSRTEQSIDVEIVANRYTIGSQVAIQLNVRDVTARRGDERARAAAEEALKLANERLKRANSDLEQFAYAASHDIQEPLRTITLYTELFRKGYGERQPPEANQFLGYIYDAAHRLQTLIAALLSYTRSTAPFEPPTAMLDSAAVLQVALANLRGLVSENRATINIGDLPPVRMHESHLVQIFQNLIGNAIKYRGTKEPRVTITGTEGRNEWLFSVMDNGIGIDPGHAKSIFGLFERLRGQNRPGSGIGLAICAKIVENYRGRIWVESVPGEGSNFFFTVPMNW